MFPLNHIAAHGDKMIAEVIIYAGHSGHASKMDNAKKLAVMRCKDIIKFGGDKDTFGKVIDYITSVRIEDKIVTEFKNRNQWKG